MSELVLTGSHLRKVFNGTVAVDDVSFTIEEKTITAIIGPNGAGKTTLFNLITGFLSPDHGEIRFRDKVLTGISPHEIARYGIARTFQDLRLLRQISVRENLLLAWETRKEEGFWHAIFSPNVAQEEKARAIRPHIRMLGFEVLFRLANELAGNLSYGQQKLLTLACCLATQAEILLLDEPVSGVDPETASQILRHLLQLKEQGRSIILIEHDIEAVNSVADQVMVMDEGEVIASGSKEKVLSRQEIVEAYLT
jgi:ABC-type branched-subunit amino acid transport system ATPase component